MLSELKQRLADRCKPEKKNEKNRKADADVRWRGSAHIETSPVLQLVQADVGHASDAEHLLTASPFGQFGGDELENHLIHHVHHLRHLTDDILHRNTNRVKLVHIPAR